MNHLDHIKQQLDDAGMYFGLERETLLCLAEHGRVLGDALGEEMTATALACILGCSPRTARRRIKALEALDLEWFKLESGQRGYVYLINLHRPPVKLRPNPGQTPATDRPNPGQNGDGTSRATCARASSRTYTLKGIGKGGGGGNVGVDSHACASARGLPPTPTQEVGGSSSLSPSPEDERRAAPKPPEVIVGDLEDLARIERLANERATLPAYIEQIFQWYGWQKPPTGAAAGCAATLARHGADDGELHEFALEKLARLSLERRRGSVALNALMEDFEEWRDKRAAARATARAHIERMEHAEPPSPDPQYAEPPGENLTPAQRDEVMEQYMLTPEEAELRNEWRRGLFDGEHSMTLQEWCADRGVEVRG
jgi:hypothetical protein